MRQVGYLALLLITCVGHPANAEPFMVGVDEFATEQHEWLSGALRYRFVTIDSVALKAALSDAARMKNNGSPNVIQLQLFDQLTLSALVLQYRQEYKAEFFAWTNDANCEMPVDESSSNGSMELSKLGHVTGRFWICDRVYGIGPTDSLPYHVVSEWDPDKLPPID